MPSKAHEASMPPLFTETEPPERHPDNTPYGRITIENPMRRTSRLWCFGCTQKFFCGHHQSRARSEKRHLNRIILKLHTGAVSQREAARILGVNKKTIVRKVRYGGRDAYAQLQRDNAKFPKSISVQFDDLETFIHTKLKPVSVVAMVESESRRILGYRVAQMPAKGRLAALSRKKYGPRPDDHGQARRELFSGDAAVCGG